MASIDPRTEGPTPRRHHAARRVGRVLANLALLLVSAVGVCGLCELTVRLTVPQQLILKRPDIWQSIDSLGWNHRANIRATVNTGERRASVYTDRDGYRVGPAGRVNADTRVLLLGDSFTEALQVEYEQSVAGLLQSDLGRQVGRPVAVRNTGVGGWDPPQYLVQARRAVPVEAPSLVIVQLYLGNDVVRERVEYLPPRAIVEVHPFRWPQRLTRHEFIDALLYPVNDALEVRSHFFILLKTRFHVLLMKLGLSAVYFPSELRRGEATSPRWNVTADICADIAKLDARYGAPTLFVLFPDGVQIDSTALRETMLGMGVDPRTVDIEQPNRLMADALRARGLDVIDVLPALRAAHASGEKLYGSVDAHFSPAGHLMAFRAIEPRVVSLLRQHPRGTHEGRSTAKAARRSLPTQSPQ